MRELDLRYDQRRERSLSDCLAKCHCIDTSKNEFRKYRSFEGSVDSHENRLAQSKLDQSHVVLDSEDVGRRAT